MAADGDERDNYAYRLRDRRAERGACRAEVHCPNEKIVQRDVCRAGHGDEMDGGHKKVISYFLRNGVASVTPFPVSAVLPRG